MRRVLLAAVFLVATGDGQDDRFTLFTSRLSLQDVTVKGLDDHFSLSSSRTFGPNERPSLQLWTPGAGQFEFRVYRVDDPVAFFAQLPDPHRFGGAATKLPVKPTLLERFHGWKRGIRSSTRVLMRQQFSDGSVERFHAWFPPKPVPVRFADLPVLNQRQLVTKFLRKPATAANANEPISLDPLPPGLYVVEATNGRLSTSVVLSVASFVVIDKTMPGRVVARVVDRETGRGIAGARLVVMVNRKTEAEATTDALGLAELKVTPDQGSDLVLLAFRGTEPAVASLEPWSLGASRSALSAYIYTDRPVYRPGHKVGFKGILRLAAPEGWRKPDFSTVNCEINDAEGNVVHRAKLDVDEYGAVRGEFMIPPSAPLGYYGIQLRTGDNIEMGGFEVEEYKKPEYEVKVRSAKARMLQGEVAEVAVEARYFFGEPVANGRVKYSVVVGRSYPYPSEEDDDEPAYYGGENTGEKTAQLDAQGRVTLRIPTAANDYDQFYRIEARVIDKANREIAGNGAFNATVGNYYLRARPASYVFAAGGVARIDVQAFDYDHKPIEGIAFRAELAEAMDKPPLASVEGRSGGSVELPLKSAGSRVVRVLSRTPAGRTVRAETYVWATGLAMAPDTEQVEVKIVPDKSSYVPGDTARVLVAPGVANADVWLTVEGRGLYSSRTKTADGGSVMFDIPVKDEHVPNVYLTAVLLHKGKYYFGSKLMKVPATKQALNVSVKPSKAQFVPGEPAKYTIDAKDSDGQPVKAQFSLGVVDEALYSVRPDMLPRIDKFFYGRTYNSINTGSSLDYYFSGEAGKRRMPLAMLRPTLAQLKPERPNDPRVRKAFPDTALWLADVETDASGRATATLEFPDSITMWRATARGTTVDTKVGSAVDRVITRKNVILRLAVPRFFTEGDEVTVSAIVNNYLPQAKQAGISLAVQGGELLDGGTREVAAAAGVETRVDFRVRAKAPGTMVLTAKAITDRESDALELDIPVRPFGVRLTEAKSGIGAATATLNFPANTNGRRATLSAVPTLADSLIDAAEYLTTFPYGCTEQTLSSFLPGALVAKLRPGQNQNLLNRKIRVGVERLTDMQNPDGGWGWWKAQDSSAFMTALAIDGLRMSGNDESPAVKRGVTWLKTEFARQPRALPDLRAYLAYVIRDKAVTETVWAQRGDMSAYGIALLGLTLEQDARAMELASRLESMAQSNDREAWWPVERDALLNIDADTSAEATAYAVKLLTRQKPQSPLLQKAVMWLLGHRTGGRYWMSTKQTAMVIYGLVDYLTETKELTAKPELAIAWNGRKVTGQKVDGTTGVTLPANAGTNRAEFGIAGEGRLYWAATGEYYSAEGRLERTGSAKLSILRDYYRLVPETINGKVVWKLSGFDGELKIGDILASRLTVTGKDWSYLLIEDPIPAGTEAVEDVSGYNVAGRPPWWQWAFGRREVRDDRTAYFETFLTGQREFLTLLKVNRAGTFRVSPARVEPMYQPGILSTTEAQTVRVVE